MKWAAIPPLLGAALTIWTCYAAGVLLLARLRVTLRRAEKFPLAFVLGAACVHLALFAIFALKIAYKPVLLSFAIVVITASLLPRNRLRADREAPFSISENLPAIGYAMLFTVFSGLYFIIAWAPETSADGSNYHLGLIARYLRAHGFVAITTTMYAGLGQGAELLYALAFAFGRHSAAALVHLSFAIALAIAMLAYGFRIGKWWVGAGAALVVYLSPVVGKDASAAYIDLVPAAVVFAAFYFLELWEESGDDRLLIPIGLLSGYAYATKYTAVTILPLALSWILWRKFKSHQAVIKPVAIVALCALAMILPWMMKDWIYLHDPIAPFGASRFANPFVHAGTIAEWAADLRRYEVPNKWTLPLEVTIRGGHTQGIIGPIFLLAPLGLLALRFRAGRRLLLCGMIMLIPYFGNVGTRFLIPSLAFFAMAMTLAVGSFPRVVAAMVLFHAIASWPRSVDAYADGSAWRIVHAPVQAALRREPEDRYLRRVFYEYVEARTIEQFVPPGERVLTMNDTAASYTSREVLVGFEAAFNQTLYDTLYMGFIDGFQPSLETVFNLHERSLRHIRVIETANPGSVHQWGVHEIRYFYHGTEIARSPAWRLRAWPNSWEVPLAFDNSPVTRWRSWESAKPGMFIETDFGADQIADEVRVVTGDDDRGLIAMQLESMNSSGQWEPVAAKQEEHDLKPPKWLRRAATAELHSKGVNYILIRDDGYGAQDFLDDPDAWGLKLLARTPVATLYQVIP